MSKGPEVRITHIGGPTTLIEVGEWRLLTDPTFDDPGRRYHFGFGTGSTKTSGPSIAPRDLPPIDAVLLSHDQHADNLDDAGRALLPFAGTVVTNVSGATRRQCARTLTVGFDAIDAIWPAGDRHHGDAVSTWSAVESPHRRRCDR